MDALDPAIYRDIVRRARPFRAGLFEVLLIEAPAIDISFDIDAA